MAAGRVGRESAVHARRVPRPLRSRDSFIEFGYTRTMTEESGAGPAGFSLPFPDRQTAGRMLGERLKAVQDWAERTVVLGLPRGGVAVAKEVAEVLGAPMDVIVTRKI